MRNIIYPFSTVETYYQKKIVPLEIFWGFLSTFF